jgi:hypothetical protein
MRVRIRQTVDWAEDIVWKVETKSYLIPWWRERGCFLFKTNAEKLAKALINPTIMEITK